MMDWRQYAVTATPNQGVPAQSAFPVSLIETESGGNWGALNNEQGAGGRGHGGRLQFGHARLQDAANAGIVPPMTPQEFAQQPPEVQTAVENWHFADIDQQSQRLGLSRYVGQTVAGIPITQDGIRAMAHLGGIGGAQRFLESGGQHNPADSFGTSLADYALRHGAGGGTAPQTAPQAGGNALAAMIPQAGGVQPQGAQQPPQNALSLPFTGLDASQFMSRRRF